MEEAKSASSNKRMKASALPNEIVEEILARLPSKPLRRFQCVSRSWRDLIASPSFHDLHSSKHAGARLFVRPAGYCESFYAASLPQQQQRPGGSRPDASTVEEILSWKLLPQGTVFPITKSCHGLVLLRCLEYDAHYAWNPSTGDILTLPDRTPFRAAGIGSPRAFVSYGMGYCSATRQHKVARMYCIDDGPFGGGTRTVCEVFTLDESTHWRPAATEPPVEWRLRVRGSQGAVLCNGSLHFVGQDGTITAFNVADETFGTVMPPPGLESGGFDLTELDGCLCAYFSTQDDPTPDYPYCIWVLRDYNAAGGGCWEWEELRCIDWGAMADADRAALKSNWIAPLATMYYPADDDGSARPKKKKMVLFGTGTCKVFAVDPRDGVPVILFSMDGAKHDGQFPTVGLFEESLASVGRTNDEIILSSPCAEAWFDVLSRLPSRTVGRFNQVCKDWRAMIKSECFVDSHLLYHQTNQSSTSPKIMFTDGKPNSFRSLEDLISKLGGELPLVDDSSKVVCSKPCYGLNAGSFMCYDFVCNPVTDYYKALPLGDNRELRGTSLFSDIARRSPHCTGGDAVFTGRFGLGYDVETGQHVLVRMAYKERNFATRDYKMECEIRYIQDMFWEELDPPQRPIADTPPAYVNGKLYWMADAKLGHYDRSWSEYEIVALDVSAGARKFELLKGPLHVHEECDVSIVELQGQLCMVCSHRRKGTLEIWAMKDNGSWSMDYYVEVGRFSPEYSSEPVTAIAIDSKDGRLLLSTGKVLGYYDPETAKMETVYSLGKHIKNKKFVPLPFGESLIDPCDRVF
ncbi:unnamed protein product [Urochloa humidicola]